MEIDGLHVEVVGDGVPTLILHGGLGVDHTAMRTLDPLSDELQLIYLDHRGNGRSARPDPATLTMAGWADDARRVGRAVAGDAPLVVIGHSYGGFVAQELAIRHPHAVRALVLICTTPGQLGTGEEPAPPGPPMPDEFAALLSALPETDDQVAVGMSALATAYVHRDPEVLRAAMAGTTFSAAAMRRGFEVLAGWSAVDRLGAIVAPTLVIAGRHDPFTSWPQAHRIADRVPDAEVVVFEDSSHFPWLDEPELFFATILMWLQRHQTGHRRRQT
jgi:proline iminopeptidase